MADPVKKFVKKVWNNLNYRCKNGSCRKDTKKNLCYREVLIDLTRDEFMQWCRDHWVHISSLSKPSIDRIDKKGHYSLNNIQIIELSENCKKDKKIVFKDGFGVCCRCKERKLIEEFVKHNKKPSGRSTRCKSCERIRSRIKRNINKESNT